MGQVCNEGGCCEELGLGTLGCPGCASLEAACADAGCTCQILHAGGQVATDGVPELVVGADRVQRVVAVLLADDPSAIEAQLAAASFSLELLPGSAAQSFVIEGNTVRGTGVAGFGTLRARFANAATCTASLRGLGTLDPGQVRVRLFDVTTGRPVNNARLVIDGDGDGLDDAGAPDTNASGVAVGALPLDAGTLTLTVFAPGYDCLTLAGLEAGVRDINLPLTPRPPEPMVTGASGKVDFEAYARQVRGGQRGSLSMAMVATSFPMEALVRFDLGLLLGGPVVATDCNAGDPCTSFEIPGVMSEKVAAWGGLVMSFPTSDLKPYFQVMGEPGLRRVWGLGGQWEVGDMEGLLRDALIVSTGDCSCDRAATCDTECSCDPDCRLSIESRFFRSMTPLLSKAAFGVTASAMGPAAPKSEWEAWIAPPYDERESNPSFALYDSDLDGATGGAIPLTRALSAFTTIAVPALPPDPAGYGLGTMEGVFVVTGVELPAVGFVPSGLGAGFDCTEALCAGHQRDPASHGYDGVVNGALVCGIDGGEAETCPGGVPTWTAPGHVGLFHAPEVERGFGGAARTALLAVPVDSFTTDAVRTTALLIDGELPAGEVDWSALEFPPFVHLELAGRELTFADNDGLTLSRLDLAALGGHWTVLAADAAAVVLPEVPAGWTDPLAPEAEPVVTTTGYVLSGGLELGDLAAADGTSLADLTDYLTGFSTEP